MEEEQERLPHVPTGSMDRFCGVILLGFGGLELLSGNVSGIVPMALAMLCFRFASIQDALHFLMPKEDQE